MRTTLHEPVHATRALVRHAPAVTWFFLALSLAGSAAGTARAATDVVYPPGWKTPVLPKPGEIRGFGTSTLTFNVSLACDSAYVSARGGLSPAVFELLGFFAEVDRLYARTDFVIGAGTTVRLHASSVDCRTSPSNDPFIGDGDQLKAVRAYRPTLPLASAGVTTHLVSGQYAGQYGKAGIASAGTPGGASITNIDAQGNLGTEVIMMAHELGHTFGTDHDGNAPCLNTANQKWVMSPLVDYTYTDFSGCTRQIIGAYLTDGISSGKFAPGTYTNSVSAPPFAFAGNDGAILTTGTFHLDGSASYDPDGGALQYYWQSDGICDVTFLSSQSAAVTDVRLNPLPPGVASRTCRFLLTVIDDEGVDSYDSVVVKQRTQLPPTGVTAVALSPTSIKVSWNIASFPIGASSYLVYRATSGGLFSKVTTLSGAASNSFTDTGLTPKTTYVYYVIASGGDGASVPSATAQATTPANPTTTTTIRVHYDVGPGNRITLRGSVAPLNWNSGIAATWTTGNVWVWSTTAIPAGTAFQYKPLFNDAKWSNGANYNGTGGGTLDITPTFP